MAIATKGFRTFRVICEMIKIEHSIFALPFAMIGMALGSRQMGWGIWPGWRIFLWIVVAMVACRSAAMTWNRIVDRDIDAGNPRTAVRALPSGLLQLRSAHQFFVGSVLVFVLVAWQLGRLPLLLSPVALFVTLFYSYTKRFTPWCHLWLGLSLAMAPAAAFIAVTGTLDVRILFLVGAVTGWTAGFDIIYSLQDREFDQLKHLHSLPAAMGPHGALTVSRIFHGLAVGCLIAAGISFGLSKVYWVGVLCAAALLAYEQSLVAPDDLSRVNLAFFTLNGYVSLGLGLFTLLDLGLRR